MLNNVHCLTLFSNVKQCTFYVVRHPFNNLGSTSTRELTDIDVQFVFKSTSGILLRPRRRDQ